MPIKDPNPLANLNTSPAEKLRPKLIFFRLTAAFAYSNLAANHLLKVVWILMAEVPDYAAMLTVALREARVGLAEGGIPIGAAIFDESGQLVGAGHNRRVQHGDPSMHGETDAFRNAGRQRSYRNLIMVTTLAPCWYCSGLVRQFGFRTLVVGESRNFQGGMDWLRSLGIRVIDLDSGECVSLLAEYIHLNPEVWNEDIGNE